MLKAECVAILDKDIADLEAVLRSLVHTRDTLKAESEGPELETVREIPIVEPTTQAEGEASTVLPVVEEGPGYFLGVDAEGGKIVKGHPMYERVLARLGK